MKLKLKHKRLIVLGVDLLLILCCAVMFFAAPKLMEILPDCAMRAMGLPCLGCGGTRCVYAFVHFDFLDSFLLHPFAFVSLVLAIYLMIVSHLAWVFNVKKAQRIFDNLTHPAYPFSYLGFFIVFAILRFTRILPTP